MARSSLYPRSFAAPHLTPREEEIVRLLARGFSGKEIANALFISPRTVEFHRSNIMRKLEVHSVLELAVWALHNKRVLLTELVREFDLEQPEVLLSAS